MKLFLRGDLAFGVFGKDGGRGSGAVLRKDCVEGVAAGGKGRFGLKCVGD